ncbi:hypothetical protein [Chryseolinea lacunae]|uniref:Uncharacterized protein n=1 Tax=Chryseolinea lacunae TaxID=2801331 RepID=A0ABS1L3K0_9BACT|nr:hypothetical protein [Chryseolinea lacunae]MBL0745146.1 hypothetical protein [Chryseolinea lacunae]
MEHEIEKRIREKVWQAEAIPVAWSKQAAWQSVRKAEQPRSRNSFRYVAAAASVLMALSFFSDDLLLQTHTPHVVVYAMPEGMPQSSIQKDDCMSEALQKAEHPEPFLTLTSRGDLRGTPSHRDPERMNNTTTPSDTLSSIAGPITLEKWMQQDIRNESTDTITHPVQHKKVIHAIVGILETSSKDTLVEHKQKVSRLKLFKRHERDLKNTLDDQEKSMTARIN